jgi:fatty-acyl-CoA synthase
MVGYALTKGEESQPLLDLTIDGLLMRAVRERSNESALIVPHQDIRWSYSDLALAVDGLAGSLLSLGLKKGDRVALCSPSRYEWIVTQFATARVGLILVCINPAYRAAELEFALNKTQSKALFIAPRFKTSDYVEILRTLAPELGWLQSYDLDLPSLPHLRHIIKFGSERIPSMLNYDDVLKLPKCPGQVEMIGKSLVADDPINIQFTSGTTGLPKGAVLSHKNIVNNAYFNARRMNLSFQDRLCIPVPLFHTFGLVLGVLACVSHAATMVLPGEGFDAGEVLTAVEAERCTALHGVPTMFIAEMDHPTFSERDLSSLRTGIVAGAPCPIEMMKRLVTQMGLAEITIAYGMTETSPIAFQTCYDDSLERRVATVGRVHPHVEVKVVDESGRTVRLGERGQVCIRGYSVMLGYWQEPEKTAEAIKDGWMHTGDLGVLDEAGYLRIVGRSKDMVIRGGENLFPREIEEYLFRHPAVADVQVFGVPDNKYGEELCAWIVRKPGCKVSEAEIRDFCRGQISHQKIPRHIRFVEAFPITASGKARKTEMRKAMIEELGLVDIT